MRRGYIRLSKAGPTLREQQEALQGAGIIDFGKEGPVYVDVEPKGRYGGAETMPQRTLAIQSLRDGDELVVSSAARLAVGRADLLEVLQLIGKRGAAVFDAAAGEAARWHPEALACFAFVERAESEQRREVTAKMRRAKAALGANAGPPRKLEGKAEENARRLWADAALTADEVAKQVGVAARTLYRRFGARAEEPAEAVKKRKPSRRRVAKAPVAT